MSAVVLSYRKLITMNVANQAINLADSGIMGHRVQCPISVDDLNRFFTWHREAGQSGPIGHFTPHEDISGASFSYILANTLSKYYTDIDGVTGGLNFGSAILDSNPDPRIRKNGKISSNDIIMSYVIYKLYGSSANPTVNVVFNLEDAYDMLPNSVFISSIESSLQAEEASVNSGAVNDMFQDLLSKDPTRFFDVTGKQIPGLFEVNSEDSVTGTWNFVENDRIELNVQFTFSNSVTVNSTTGDSDNMSSKVAIPAGTTFKIRLQFLATNTPTAAAAIQKVYVAATTEEIVRQAAVQKEAAQKATDAFTIATQATAAAQAQAAAEQAKYNAAVIRNAQQQKAVASANAAVAAAQSALAAAQTSGNQANIQQQNAAAIAAKAVLTNQQAIAELAIADLETAATAVVKATSTLNAAQTAAANAAVVQAAANAASANASLALETANAAALASTIATENAASDPFTQALEAEKNAILDPQNLVTILAKANSVTNKRKAAFNTAIDTFAKEASELNNYNSILYNMNYAIAIGSNDSQIQLYKAMVIGASNIVNSVRQTSKSAASTLEASYTAELTAIQHATLASSNAASLSATVAGANRNSANRSLTSATTAYVYASTMNTYAAAAVTEAQDILNNRVNNGAIMTEVKTRTQALLTANTTYAATTSTMNGALAKMMNASNSFQKVSTLAVEAQQNISSVSASNMFTLNQYKTSVTTSSAYQKNILSNAQLNQIAIQVNSSLIRLNAANTAVATEKANVALAQMAINTALASGAILSEITVLKGAYSAANDSLTQALLVQKSAQEDYDRCTHSSANGQAQLLQSDAMSYFNASITQTQLATDNIIYYSTLLKYATEHPTAFPPVDGLSSSTVYSTQMGVWNTYLGNFQTLSGTLLTQYNTNLTRAYNFMVANPSISTYLGNLCNYYIANSNSSHIIFQVNSLTSILASLSNIGLSPPELEAEIATYSAQSNTALTDTVNAYNTYLADTLIAQSITVVSSIGQEILIKASEFQLAQIDSATMNNQIHFYNSTMSAVNMLQLEYDQASSVMEVTQQELSTTTTPAQLTILQQKYANAAASKASLANKINGASKSVSTMRSDFGLNPDGSILGYGFVSGFRRPVVSLRAFNYSGSGAWLDKSGNGKNATLENGNISKNIEGNGIVFDGTTSWTFPNVSLGNAWSVNVWYKNTMTTNGIPLSSCIVTQINGGGDANLGIISVAPNQINMGFYTSGMWRASSDVSSYFTPNTWVNIIGTWDGTNLNTYINGALIESVASAVAFDGGTGYRIGSIDNTNYLVGEMGEVSIYNYALTHANVTANYNASLLTYTTSSKTDSIYSMATTLRQAELAVAKKNELVQQANNTYNKYSQLNDKLQAVNQSTNSVLDKISVAMAKGANLATIHPLQTQLAAIQEDTVNMHLQSAKLYNTFLTLSTIISPDASFIAKVNSTSNDTFTATISARLNESAQQLQTAQIEDSAAATAFAQANATLTVVSTQFSIKKQQGISFEEMAPLTSTFTAASLNVANTNILLNFANTSLAQARSNYNSIYSTYSVGSPSIYSTFANTSNNLVNSFSTLSSGQSKQISSLRAATSNALTAELTNAYMGMLNYSTLAQRDYKQYEYLLVKYNTQMEGANTEKIASIYTELTNSYNKYVAHEHKEILYTAAYLSSLNIATIDPQSKAILSVTALNQTKLLEGARVNQLYTNLQEANSALFTINNDFVSNQSAYAIAQSDLQIARANDSSQEVLDVKMSTLFGVSNQLAQVQIKYNLAQSAYQLANSYVNMNPNAQSILDTASAKYLAQANLAQANVLVSQYNLAVANEKKAYDALQLANSALETAQKIFNSVITAGSDIASIKAARDAQNAAAFAASQAALVENNAMNALNQALENANLDQIAHSLIITARLTNENTTAGGAVNAAQVQLQNYSTILATALTNLTFAKEANVAAVSTLTYSITPSISTFNVVYTPTNTTIISTLNTVIFTKWQESITDSSMDYRYLLFSSASQDGNFYIRLKDPADSQNLTPWVVFFVDGTFSVIEPTTGNPYYGPVPYTNTSKFLITYENSIFEYYLDGVSLFSFNYLVSNPIQWEILNWTANSAVTILYAGMGPPGAGLSRQEIADIQQATDAVTSSFVAAQLAFNTAMNDFTNEAKQVSSLTQTFSTTTSILKINTDNNTLLYNGFVYNQTYNKYVLQSSYLPIPVIAGSPFNLYSMQVNPIDMGVYNPTTSYVLGNLVNYPDSYGAQYMCAVSLYP